ncbi:MAG: hypothetical protein JSR34_06405 [Proteobacteria bacterium]|nr:hypothetical protein [Pseudomonadota bacterium]
MNKKLISEALANMSDKSALSELSEVLAAELPEAVDFVTDTWEVIGWVKRIGTKRSEKLHFGKIRQPEMRNLAKIWVLHGRMEAAIGAGSARQRIDAASALSSQLSIERICSVTTDHFHDAQRWLSNSFGKGTAFRTSSSLAQLSRWLGRILGKPLDFRSTLVNPCAHGRTGTDRGREAKRVPDQVIGDLLQARNRGDLLRKDSYFLDLTMVLVGTGFRIAELTLLPSNCKRKEDGRLQILHFPEKNGDPIPRPVADRLATAVEAALDNLKGISDDARKILRAAIERGQVNWRHVLRDVRATEYFVAKWASDWINDEKNSLFPTDRVWFNAKGRWIDAIGALFSAEGNKGKAAKQLGIPRNAFYQLLEKQQAAMRGERRLSGRLSGGKHRQRSGRLNADRRVVSKRKFEVENDVHLSSFSCGGVAASLLKQATDLQLSGATFPTPSPNRELEREFSRTSTALLLDGSGRTVLSEENALLLVPRCFLSVSRELKYRDVEWVGWSEYSRWLSGEKRSHGTGNFEDSVFARLGIVDHRTGKIAKFTSHDIRHWLNSLYQEGGLTDDQISLIFNRKSPQQTPVYDQTPLRTRVERLKHAVRTNQAAGGGATVYQSLVAEFSREEADRYLEAAVRMVNPMPHGACTLNWSTVPCPHHLSCFSREDAKGGCCEHLFVDLGDRIQMKEIGRLAPEADLMIEVLESQGLSDSPSSEHSRRIARNTGALIAQSNVDACGKGPT